MNQLSSLRRWRPVRPVDAHCDIPCGIYDPISAKIAAQTVLKMVMRIEALSGQMDTAAGNSFGRYVAVKEQHAELTKPRDRHPLARLLQARAPRESPRPAHQGMGGHEAGVEEQAVGRPRRRQAAR